MYIQKKIYRFPYSIMITSILLLGISFFAGPLSADRYPGDTTYTSIVQEIYHGVSSDNIILSFNLTINDRKQLCETLVEQHNNGLPGSASETNSAYINEVISLNSCLNALWYSSGYNDSSGLDAWTGELTGTWYNNNDQSFTDPATWEKPIGVSTNDPQNDLSNGVPRVYNFQKVIFGGSDRTDYAKYGWNQSHPDIAYIWGWDPKDNDDQHGMRGTHVGWTFSQGQTKCIIWVTKEESFLECIKPMAIGKRRTSAGLNGIGQWDIGQKRKSRIEVRKEWFRIP